MCFRVRQDGTVEIRAPRLCPDFLIELFLRRNRERIARQRNEALARAAERFVTVRLVGKEMPVLPAPPGSGRGAAGKGLRLSAGGHAGGADRAAAGIL